MFGRSRRKLSTSHREGQVPNTVKMLWLFRYLLGCHQCRSWMSLWTQMEYVLNTSFFLLYKQCKNYIFNLFCRLNFLADCLGEVSLRRPVLNFLLKAIVILVTSRALCSKPELLPRKLSSAPVSVLLMVFFWLFLWNALSCALGPSASSMFLDHLEEDNKSPWSWKPFWNCCCTSGIECCEGGSALEYSNLLEWHKEADWYGQTIALQYRDGIPAAR